MRMWLVIYSLPNEKTSWALSKKHSLFISSNSWSWELRPFSGQRKPV